MSKAGVGTAAGCQGISLIVVHGGCVSESDPAMRSRVRFLLVLLVSALAIPHL